MGVINVTPNSFSDQNSLLLDNKKLIDKIIAFKNYSNIIFDFGFESTAPMNKAISAAEELQRFDSFFERIKSIDLSDQWISFDTYRPSNYLYFETKFKSRYKNCNYVFNDVSGVVDDELLDLLKTKKNHLDFYYILASTQVPDRSKVSNHMDFIINTPVVKQTAENFLNSLAKINDNFNFENIILDPCFGFSKTYEQNWELVNNVSVLCNELQKNIRDFTMLFGLSKKSFLRKSLGNSTDPFNDSEILHKKLIVNFLKKKTSPILFRVHDPLIVEDAYALSREFLF